MASIYRYNTCFVFVVVILALARFSLAFPQGDLDMNNISPVDGFVFDGPVNRPLISPNRSLTSSITTTTTITTPTPVSTTSVDRFETCVKNCPSTPEYNPVCGTDSVDYTNPGRLNCAAACGKSVSIGFYGRCTR